MATTAAAKQNLRSTIRGVLGRLTAEEVRDQSSLVCRFALTMGCLDRAKGISVFLSRPVYEVQTTHILTDCTQRGLRIYIPFIVPGVERKMEMLELFPGEDVRSFERDKWGIPVLPNPEKRKRADPQSIDIVFTPGVAFDLTGRRLGNGKGYYDSFFIEYDQQRAALGLDRVLKYGLALEKMIVPDVPVDKHDVLLDGVITPSGVHSSMHC